MTKDSKLKTTPEAVRNLFETFAASAAKALRPMTDDELKAAQDERRRTMAPGNDTQH